MLKKANSLSKIVLLGSFFFLAFSVASAKTYQIKEDNTGYEADVSQKLAAIAIPAGVKEPIKLSLQSGVVTVSGSTTTKCQITVGSDSKPKISNVSCTNQ